MNCHSSLTPSPTFPLFIHLPFIIVGHPLTWFTIYLDLIDKIVYHSHSVDDTIAADAEVEKENIGSGSDFGKGQMGKLTNRSTR